MMHDEALRLTGVVAFMCIATLMRIQVDDTVA
jgi:hypothetical protein